MYQLMDGADTGYDIQQVLGYLRALVQGRPSGLAIDRRTGRQPHTSQPPHTLRDLANHKYGSN